MGPGNARAAPPAPGTPHTLPEAAPLACPSLRLLTATFQSPCANRTGHSTQQHHPAIVPWDPSRAALPPWRRSRDKPPAGCPRPAGHCSGVQAPLQAASRPLAAPTGSLTRPRVGLSVGARGVKPCGCKGAFPRLPGGQPLWLPHRRATAAAWVRDQGLSQGVQSQRAGRALTRNWAPRAIS